ncbi:hypothetical protein [Salegentibacter salegens]|uniref:hypothetical protein n=1 Tax=Salegentibacter salegens TaxID=143223 RepID=UPI0009A65090|nr:hypothetical protein [Salegentibacter salegens]PRX40004.1 hypothetical protein LY58_03230 [Salegentibacter salegens]
MRLHPPTLQGKEEQKDHEYLYWEFHEFGGKQALLKGNWKVVRLGVNDNPQAKVALFNIESDPGEQKNLIDEYPQKARELEQLMDSVRTPNRNFNF